MRRFILCVYLLLALAGNLLGQSSATHISVTVDVAKTTTVRLNRDLVQFAGYDFLVTFKEDGKDKVLTGLTPQIQAKRVKDLQTTPPVFLFQGPGTMGPGVSTVTFPVKPGWLDATTAGERIRIEFQLLDGANIDVRLQTDMYVVIGVNTSNEPPWNPPPAGTPGAGTITGLMLADGSVSEPKIAPNAVTGPKIQTGAVTGPKIANNAVTRAKIGPGAVFPVHLWNPTPNPYDPTAHQNQLVMTDPTGSSWVFAPHTFLSLGDTPTTWGTAGQVPVINAAGDGLEWGAGGATAFTDLSDTPATIDPANDAFKFVTVNMAGNKLVFSKAPAQSVESQALDYTNRITAAEQGNWVVLSPTNFFQFDTIKRTLLNLTDTPAAMGTAGQILQVNAGATALEWGAAPAPDLEAVLTAGDDANGKNIQNVQRFQGISARLENSLTIQDLTVMGAAIPTPTAGTHGTLYNNNRNLYWLGGAGARRLDWLPMPTGPDAGKVIQINALGNAYELASVGAQTFLALTDTPNNFPPDRVLMANATFNGLEWKFPPLPRNGTIIGDHLKDRTIGNNKIALNTIKAENMAAGVIPTTVTAFTDTPATMGTTGQILQVNGGATALEWHTLPINHLDAVLTAGNDAKKQSIVGLSSAVFEDLTGAPAAMAGTKGVLYNNARHLWWLGGGGAKRLDWMPTPVAGDANKYVAVNATGSAYELKTMPTIPGAIGDLSDVDPAAANPLADGMALIWKTDHFEGQALPSGVTTLAALNDTDVGTPAAGNVLEWNATNGKWVAGPPPAAGAVGIGDLSDVDTTTTVPTDGQHLGWDDAKKRWVPETAAAGITTFAGLTDTPANFIQGRVLMSNGTTDGLIWAVPPAPTIEDVIDSGNDANGKNLVNAGTISSNRIWAKQDFLLTNRTGATPTLMTGSNGLLYAQAGNLLWMNARVTERLNWLPTPAAADSNKYVQVNAAGDGYELAGAAAAPGLGDVLAADDDANGLNITNLEDLFLGDATGSGGEWSNSNGHLYVKPHTAGATGNLDTFRVYENNSTTAYMGVGFFSNVWFWDIRDSGATPSTTKTVRMFGAEYPGSPQSMDLFFRPKTGKELLIYTGGTMTTGAAARDFRYLQIGDKTAAKPYVKLAAVNAPLAIGSNDPQWTGTPSGDILFSNTTQYDRGRYITMIQPDASNSGNRQMSLSATAANDAIRGAAKDSKVIAYNIGSIYTSEFPSITSFKFNGGKIETNTHADFATDAKGTVYRFHGMKPKTKAKWGQFFIGNGSTIDATSGADYVQVGSLFLPLVIGSTPPKSTVLSSVPDTATILSNHVHVDGSLNARTILRVMGNIEHHDSANLTAPDNRMVFRHDGGRQQYTIYNNATDAVIDAGNATRTAELFSSIYRRNAVNDVRIMPTGGMLNATNKTPGGGRFLVGHMYDDSEKPLGTPNPNYYWTWTLGDTTPTKYAQMKVQDAPLVIGRNTPSEADASSIGSGQTMFTGRVSFDPNDKARAGQYLYVLGTSNTAISSENYILGWYNLKTKDPAKTRNFLIGWNQANDAYIFNSDPLDTTRFMFHARQTTGTAKTVGISLHNQDDETYFRLQGTTNGLVIGNSKPATAPTASELVLSGRVRVDYNATYQDGSNIPGVYGTVPANQVVRMEYGSGQIPAGGMIVVTFKETNYAAPPVVVASYVSAPAGTPDLPVTVYPVSATGCNIHGEAGVDVNWIVIGQYRETSPPVADVPDTDWTPPPGIDYPADWSEETIRGISPPEDVEIDDTVMDPGPQNIDPDPQPDPDPVIPPQYEVPYEPPPVDDIDPNAPRPQKIPLTTDTRSRA